MNEQEMRDSTVPTLDAPVEVMGYIESLVTQDHDYGTCVYAMSMAAVAAYNYVARKLGVSGFQASCADLDIVRRNRRIDGPFMLVNGENVVYPQYDLVGDVAKKVEEWRGTYGRDRARELLNSERGTMVAGRVKEHWVELAGLPGMKDEGEAT